MLDPYNITSYNRTQNELEEFILSAMAVAGKTAKTIFPKVYSLSMIIKITNQTCLHFKLLKK